MSADIPPETSDHDPGLHPAEAEGARERAAEKALTTVSLRLAPPVVVLALVYLYLWLWVDTTCLYHGAGSAGFPAFSVKPSFWQDFFRRPGGPVECLSALLSQSYCYSWAGALVLTTMAALLGHAAHRFAEAVAGTQVPFVWSVPGLFVLALSGLYAHKLATLVAILLAVLTACVYARLKHSGRIARFAASAVLSVPLYYLTAGAYLLSAVLCGLWELREKRGFPLFLLHLALGAAVPCLVGIYGLEVFPARAYGRFLPFEPGRDMTGDPAVLCLYLFLVMMGIGGLSWRLMSKPGEERGGATAESPTTARGGGGESDGRSGPWMAPVPLPPSESKDSVRFGDFLARPSVQLELVLLAAAVVVLSSFDSNRAKLWRISSFANQGLWQKVLQEADGIQLDGHSFGASHAITRALYETGRLPSEMFAYPQHPGGFMLAMGLASKRGVSIIRRVMPLEVQFAEAEIPASEELCSLRMRSFFQIGDLNLQLGLVNQAEHEAHEALEIFGEHPQILRRLALINTVKGQPEAAKVFLRALGQHVHYGAYAERVLQDLQDDPLRSNDPWVQQARSVMVERDTVVLYKVFEDRFEELLQKNRRNRMAFEYRMAFYLLNLLLKDFVGQLGRLDDFDHPDIPRHYEEAILIYEGVTREKVDLHGREISPQTQRLFQEFLAGLALFHRMGDIRKAREALYGDFGRTYFYYYFLAEL
jgi:hypothetical protein